MKRRQLSRKTYTSRPLQARRPHTRAARLWRAILRHTYGIGRR